MLFCLLNAIFIHLFINRERIFPKICNFAAKFREKSWTNDALLFDTHLTEGVWKTLKGIVRSLSRGEPGNRYPHNHILALHTLWRVAFLFVIRGPVFQTPPLRLSA